MDGWIGPKPSQSKSKRRRKKKHPQRANPAHRTHKNSKQRQKFQTGDLVTAPFDGEMFDCKILKIVGDEAKVQWIGYEDDGPSWVQTTQMKLKEASKVKPKDWHEGSLLGMMTKEDLDSAFAFLLSIEWSDYRTKSTFRRVAEWGWDGLSPEERISGVPEEYAFLQPLISELLAYLQNCAPNEIIVPIQCFMCLYDGPQDSCPNHRHRCRQVTLSLGSPRKFIVDREHEVQMTHGDVIILNQQPHSLPKGGSRSPRISINIFYAFQSDFEKGIVSVNSS